MVWRVAYNWGYNFGLRIHRYFRLSSSDKRKYQRNRRAHLCIGEIMKIKLSIHPIFIVFAVILGYLGYFSILFFYILTVVLHECAHAMVAHKLGYQLNHITLMPYGAAISGQNCFFSNLDEVKIALAGPALNIVLSTVGCALWWIEPQSYIYTSQFVYANWAVGVTNLLPIFPLDGGRIMLALLSLHSDRITAFKRVKAVGIIFATFVLVGFFVTTLFVPNYTMLVFGSFLFISSIIDDKSSYYSSIVFLQSKQDKLRFGLKVREVAVPRSIPLYRLFACLSRDEITNFCVVDEKYSVIARFNEKQLESWLKIYPASITLNNIISK